ncbi:hypothetical protein PRIPAC_89006, partial [Pristionchus pacificus]
SYQSVCTKLFAEMSFACNYSFLNAPMESHFAPSVYEDASQCYNCIGHCICTSEFFSNFEEDSFETDNFEVDLKKYNYLDIYQEIDEGNNSDHSTNYETVWPTEITILHDDNEEESNEEFEAVDYDQEENQIESDLENSENSEFQYGANSSCNRYDTDNEEQNEAETYSEYAGTSDCDNEEILSRCITPVQLDEERWESYIKHLEFTQRHFAMEIDAENIAPGQYKETCFTVIKNEMEFFIVVPFGNSPVYQSMTFPVNQELINEIIAKIPSWMSYRLHELDTLEGFKEFAQFFRYDGSGYRMALLMKRAINEAIKGPERRRRVAEMDDDSDSDDDNDDFFATPSKIRERRAKRDAAAKIDGRTPFGQRRPMRQRSLFRDEEEAEGRVVKRRKLDLEMED